MKTKILLCTALVCILSAVMVTFIVTKHNNVRIHDFITSFDVLAAGENNSNVTCRCSLLNHECSARNGGNICLQGYNVNCNDKDSSCD